jgi:flagellar biogenesis protein FliO
MCDLMRGAGPGWPVALFIGGVLGGLALLGAGPAVAGDAADAGRPAAAVPAPAALAEDADRVAALLEASRLEAARAVGAAESATGFVDVLGSIDMPAELLKIGLLLLAMCAMGFLTVRVFGPRTGSGSGGPDDVIQVREQRRLDPKTTLYLVEVAGQPVLLAVSDRQVRKVAGTAELDEAAVRRALDGRAPRPTGVRTFAALLRSRGSAGAERGAQTKKS